MKYSVFNTICHTCYCLLYYYSSTQILFTDYFIFLHHDSMYLLLSRLLKMQEKRPHLIVVLWQPMLHVEK